MIELNFRAIVARIKKCISRSMYISSRRRSSTANVFDVAAYILEKIPGDMSTWKLQKLVYYCQAWHSVWEDKALFPERIEAWFAGPVVPNLYNIHKGKFSITRQELTVGDSNKLLPEEKGTIDKVLDTYAKFSGYQLSQMSHRERPWKEARGDCKDDEICHNEITLEKICEFYSSVL